MPHGRLVERYVDRNSFTFLRIRTGLCLHIVARSPADQRSSLRQQGTLNPRPHEVQHESFRNSDFFDPDDLLQIKYEMLRQVDVDKQPVNQAAKAFGFSRPSFYQAQTAFQEAGPAGLLPQKRGPRSGHKLTGELMQYVAQLRTTEPEISTAQLAQRVAQRFDVSVHPRVNCSVKKKLR